MDSLTHIALGAVIGELFTDKQFGKKAMIWGALAQSLPTVEVKSAELKAGVGVLTAYVNAGLVAERQGLDLLLELLDLLVARIAIERLLERVLRRAQRLVDVVQSGVGNLGTHSCIDLARVAADVLSVPWDQVQVNWGDTSKHVPWSCMSVGSQTVPPLWWRCGDR